MGHSSSHVFAGGRLKDGVNIPQLLVFFFLKPRLFKLGMDIYGISGEGVCSSWPGVHCCWQASSPVPQHVALAAAGKWLDLQCIMLSQNSRLNLTPCS